VEGDGVVGAGVGVTPGVVLVYAVGEGVASLGMDEGVSEPFGSVVGGVP
jgi:hypothetical protein